MAIVKRLVDFMDGTIDITSAQGRGTTVTIKLHLKLADEEEITGEQKIVHNMDLGGKRCLLVEDNELNREIATEMLSDIGITVEEAINGLEAVDRVRTKGTDYYDFTLMDIQMPFMNGYDATKEIRKLPGVDKLVIIALSANAFKEDRQKSLSAGMNNHIAKPIQMNQLIATLSEYL